jgi:hypothetical protein
MQHALTLTIAGHALGELGGCDRIDRACGWVVIRRAGKGLRGGNAHHWRQTRMAGGDKVGCNLERNDARLLAHNVTVHHETQLGEHSRELATR